jgi:hypothetical protein
VQAEDTVAKGNFLESKWHPFGNRGVTIVIDSIGGETASPSQKAQRVRAVTAAAVGYHDLGIQDITLKTRSAVRWTFRVGSAKRVDYFLNDCNTGIAVLGSTPSSQFHRYSALFRRVAASVRVDCTNPPSTPPAVSTPSLPHPRRHHTPSPSPDFCATHNCIPNFPNGRGTVVQCADGSYSHSGGIQGACSHHGGVAGGP